MKNSHKIIFLHHSTGNAVWNGDRSSLPYLVGKIRSKISGKKNQSAKMLRLFKEHNHTYETNYIIEERSYPSKEHYGWRNYPYDYYNIWVKNAGAEAYLHQPTLEILTKEYQTIIFKHCFPVSNIQIDQDTADINSNFRSIGNYKLQYMALREKFHQFPDTKFIVWTGAALIKPHTNEEEAKRAREFFTWVINEWDIPNDNVFVWDFFTLQTEGDLYFQEKHARSGDDSHPNNEFSDYAATLLYKRIIDVIENNGLKTELTGK